MTNREKPTIQKPEATAPKKSDNSTPIKRRRINFNFSAPEASNVVLVGDFNDWDYTKTMKKDKDGVWRARIDLHPGKYQYRYLVDGEWQNDPKCESLQPNEYGTYNCVVEVSN